MTIEHSKQLNEFLSFYIATKVNGELKYETIIDYFQSNFRLVELNTEIEYSFEFQSKDEKEIENQIGFEIEK